ncbi:molybdate ABC transporter substrate-binding protein [Mucilaginibacter hurinus]|uniref:molybdate ABC transporter substrate-binding protein n=1 Tax=Mucilaginibacter hurinus TaxID=2201324 RepID=UPI001F15E9A4|nr:molybdate ABC transporter substrate-binding protein [Mucilaginibacter hurinus]
MNCKNLSIVFLFFFHLGNIPAFAQNLRIAAAANLQALMLALKADFKKHTGITAEIITGSSGKLVAQISNGAPYDVFLSADMQYPETLHARGFTTGKPVVYAMGTLIICTSKKQMLDKWQQILSNPETKKIAIANPATAPYGKAAGQVLNKIAAFAAVKSKVVYGESVAQVNTYLTTGVADIGFTAKSVIYDTGNTNTLSWQEINPQTYQPIKQGIVILKHGAGNPAAKKFYHYLLGHSAKHIFKNYGYKPAS